MDQFHIVGGCLASKTSPGHCLIYLGTWIRASGFTWLDCQSPLETRGIQNHCSKLCSPWPPDATSSQSPPLSPLGQQDWQEARGDREGTQTHLKGGEIESHSPDLRTKLRLTDTGGQFGDTHPTCGKTWNQVQVFGLFQLVFSFCPVTSWWRNAHCWSQEDVMSQKAKVWGKENGKKDPRWQEFFLAGMPLFINFLLMCSYHKCRLPRWH